MRFITALLIVALGYYSAEALTSSTSTTSSSCDAMTPFGKPTVLSSEKPTYLCRKMYVLEHSATRKTAYWSAEHIIGKEQTISATRINAFKIDPDLPKSEAATPEDYTKSGYDQGHMSPVGDMHKDANAMLESFYMSNMVPQVPGNNRDGWNHLEGYVREMSQARQDLYIITGPIYQCDPGCSKTIGKNKVLVPTHLYKIVYDPHQRVALSFIVPNIPFTIQNLDLYITTVKDVEQATSIKFFPTAKTTIRDSKHLWTSKSSD